MTEQCSFSKRVKTGDGGQRYEIRYKDTEGVEHVMGWAEDPANLVACVEEHPSWHSPRVIDRGVKFIDELEYLANKAANYEASQHNIRFIETAKPEAILKLIAIAKAAKELLYNGDCGYESCARHHEFEHEGGYELHNLLKELDETKNEQG